MPTVSPQLLVQSSLRSVTKDAKFAQLSPASQDAILKASQSSNPTEGLANNPELQGALAEARQKGFLSNDPLWMALGKALAITGGAALTAGALGGLSGAAGAVPGGTDAATLGTESMVPGAELGASTAAASTALTPAVTTAATTGFGAALKSALPSIIGAGASVGGAAIASHGNTEAAKIQAASADKALAQAKEIYQQNVARQAPFVGLGTSALGPLSFGLGLPDPNVKAAADAAASPPASSSVAPGAVDASGKPMAGAGAGQAPVTPPTYAQQTSASLNSLGQSGTVRMLNPQTGQIHLIPPDQVSQALASGGVRA